MRRNSFNMVANCAKELRGPHHEQIQFKDNNKNKKK